MDEWDLSLVRPSITARVIAALGVAFSAACFTVAVASLVSESFDSSLRDAALRAFAVMLFGAFGLVGLVPAVGLAQQRRFARAVAAHDGVCLACGATRPAGLRCRDCGATLPPASQLTWTQGGESALVSLAAISGGLSLVSIAVMLGTALADPHAGYGTKAGVLALVLFLAACGGMIAVAGGSQLTAALRRAAPVGWRLSFSGRGPNMRGLVALDATRSPAGVVVRGRCTEVLGGIFAAEPALAEPALDALARLLAHESARDALEVSAQRVVEWTAPVEAPAPGVDAVYRAEHAGDAGRPAPTVRAHVSVYRADARETLACVLGDEEAAALCARVGDEGEGEGEGPGEGECECEGECEGEACWSAVVELATMVDRVRADAAVREAVLRAATRLGDEPDLAALERRALRLVGAA